MRLSWGPSSPCINSKSLREPCSIRNVIRSIIWSLPEHQNGAPIVFSSPRRSFRIASRSPLEQLKFPSYCMIIIYTYIYIYICQHVIHICQCFERLSHYIPTSLYKTRCFYIKHLVFYIKKHCVVYKNMCLLYKTPSFV